MKHTTRGLNRRCLPGISALILSALGNFALCLPVVSGDSVPAASRVAGRFEPLPPGAVEPRGWLRDWALAARDGITGHLDERHPTFGKAWTGVPIEAPGANPDGTGWPLEQCSYWLDGLVRLGYALRDDFLIGKAKARLDRVVEGVLAGGETFVYWRPREVLEQPFNAWAHSHMGRALTAYYAASGDPKVLAALNRVYGRLDLGKLKMFFGDDVDGGMNVDPMLETYRLGGDPEVLRQALAFARRPDFGPAVEAWRRGEIRITHGVIIQEALRIPAILGQYTGEPTLLEATVRGLDRLEEMNGLPSGVISSEEWIAGIGAFRCIETCDIPCAEWNDIWLLRLTGESRFGDRAERAFFNAGPAAVARDFQTAIYYQSTDRMSPSLPGDEPVHAPGGNSFRSTPLACPHVLCCVGNLNRVLPFYLGHMWMKTADDGLAASLHGPCDVTAKVAGGVPVKIQCRTDYPFRDTIQISVEPEKPIGFPLHLRVPTWCADPLVTIGPMAQKVTTDATGFIVIRREWARGDTLTLTLPMQVKVARGRETPYPVHDYFVQGKREAVGLRDIANPYAAVSRGPLLFALPIPDRSPDEAAPDARWQYAWDAAASAVTLEERPMPERWNWPLEAPVRLVAPAQAFDWKPTNARPLPAAPVKGKGRETITLVPYGCAKFRVAMFPVTERFWSEADGGVPVPAATR